jgi:hypothetical protein
MSRKQTRTPLGAVPPPRGATVVPRARPIPKTPGGDPLVHAPSPHVSRAPEERPAGKPPNPRKAGLTRNKDGGILKDLCTIFPDLPRPARPATRVPSRALATRRSVRGGRR